MTIASDDLRDLDRLLDEALSLAPEERSRWLDRLGPEHARLATTLRGLLAETAGPATSDLIDRPPALFAFAAGADEEPGLAGLAAGDTVGPYRLLREIGVGGMGVVWLAERDDKLIDRPIALKLPLFSLHHRALAERFARERVILARLTHPNIARLYDTGITADGQPYLALEYVEGESLTAWCDGRRSTLRERIALVVQVLRAVQYAHANLVIHRDLKPSNILVTADSQVRLLDFGIAKLVSEEPGHETELTRLAGRALTVSYAAPELVAGNPIGIASDVYSIGVILYELLCGARPYRPRDASSVALQDCVLHAEPIRPSLAASDDAARLRGLASGRKLAAALAGDLDTIILKALKKSPEDRYPTAAALAEDLERHLRGDAIDARADSALYRATRLVTRHRAGFAAASLIAVALIAGTSVAIWQAREARREAQRASAVQAFVLDLFRANSVEQADPVRARQATARELLDRGVARIAQSLGDQPQARLGLLETLASLYAELGLFAEASELGSQRVDLARRIYGENDLRVAQAIGDQVVWLNAREGTAPGEIDPLVAEALRIHDAGGDTTSVARARLHERAGAHYVRRSMPLALEHAERAVAIYRAAHPQDRGFPEALIALGNIRQRQGNSTAALATYQEALAIARSLKVPDHLLVKYLYRTGEVSAFLDHGEQADALLREALQKSERVNGPRHPMTAAVRRAYARNLAWTGRLDEAAREAARTIADVMAGESREAYFVAETHRMLFDVHWARGDIVAARNGTNAAIAALAPDATDSFNLAELYVQQAMIETAYGRPSEALSALARARELAQRLGLARESRMMGNLTLREGKTRVAAGDWSQAREMLEEQLRHWRDADAGMTGPRVAIHATLVDALLGEGNIDRARQTAREAHAELERATGASEAGLSRAEIERSQARVLMAERNFEAALVHLDRAAAIYAGIQVADSPFRAEIEALRALCLARLDRRSEAASAVALARAAQAVHGALGDVTRHSLREAQSVLDTAIPATPATVRR